MMEELLNAIKLLREYCEGTKCKECKIKEKIHCDYEINSDKIPPPYVWSEYN